MKSKCSIARKRSATETVAHMLIAHPEKAAGLTSVGARQIEEDAEMYDDLVVQLIVIVVSTFRPVHCASLSG